MVQLEQDEILETIGTHQGQKSTLVDSNLLHNKIKDSKIIFNLLHVNIRSMVKNIDKLLLLLESFNLYFNDIIVLSETFKISSIELCNIPNYQLFYNYADYNKNDGVIILVKKHISPEFSTFKLPVSLATVSRLCCVVNNIKIGITAVYKPPPISKTTFIDDIHAYIHNITRISNNFEIFVGDVNINILNVDNDVHNYLSVMSLLGFESYINTATRFDSNACLDHVFVNQKLKSNNLALDSYVLDSHMTDHGPIMLNIVSKNDNLNTTNNSPQLIRKNKLDIDKFKALLSSHDWTCVLDDSNPESSTNNFITTFKNLQQEATFEYIIKNKKPKKIKEWISNGIITSIRHRDKMKRRLLHNYSVELENEYKRYRNSLNSLIGKQKNNFYKNQINNNKGNIKKIYEIIKNATNENISKSNFLKITNDRGENFENDFAMADHCNNYFATIGTKMAEKIPIPRNPINLNFNLQNSMFLSPVTENEMINYISSLKNTSSPGLDGIASELIKQTHAMIVKPLVHIINRIFVTGIVPRHFKISVITPIHKAGSKTVIGNYRPISLISNFAKLFEKCMKDRLLMFFKTNNILSESQYGFQQGCSTDDALNRLISQITLSLNEGKKCAAIFIDLAKAFDTVPHDKLLDVLWHYGVRGTVSEVLRNYLEQRYQLVRVNNVLSDKQLIKIGVPQGTVLGPILFISYINLLLSLHINGSIISYADDTVLVFEGDTWDEVRNKMINGLSVTELWLECFRLSLNLQKTKYIAFSLTNANRPDYSSIVVNDRQVNEVSHMKYLGIVVDRFLKWQPHVDYLSNKIRTLIHKFYILREILSLRTLITIYKSLVESLIRYGILVWGGLYNNALDRLNVAQKYIIKIMYRKSRLYPSEQLFSGDVCNIRTLYVMTVAAFIHKNKTTKKIVQHSYCTRARMNSSIAIPLNHNNLNLKSVVYLGPKIYNLIPGKLKKITNLRNFKIKSREYILRESNVFEILFK